MRLRSFIFLMAISPAILANTSTETMQDSSLSTLDTGLQLKLGAANDKIETTMNGNKASYSATNGVGIQAGIEQNINNTFSWTGSASLAIGSMNGFYNNTSNNTGTDGGGNKITVEDVSFVNTLSYGVDASLNYNYTVDAINTTVQPFLGAGVLRHEVEWNVSDNKALSSANSLDVDFKQISWKALAGVNLKHSSGLLGYAQVSIKNPISSSISASAQLGDNTPTSQSVDGDASSTETAFGIGYQF